MKKLILILFLIVSPCYAGVEFDEVDDFISVADNATLTLPDGAWYVGIFTYMDDNDGDFYQYLLSNNAVHGINSFNALTYESGNSDSNWLKVIVGDGDGTCITPEAQGNYTVIGSWFWIFCQRDTNSSEVQIWTITLGGTANKRVGYADTNLNAVDGDIFYIGKREDSNADRYYGGKIGEVFKADMALTQAQMELIANSKIKGMVYQVCGSNLKWYLQLDDESDGTSGDGDTFVDRSGNGNNGTGDDGANNTGLTCKGEEVLSYP